MTIENKMEDYTNNLAVTAIMNNNIDEVANLLERGLITKDLVQSAKFIGIDGSIQTRDNPKTLFEIAVSLNRSEIVMLFLTFKKQEEIN